MFVVGILVAANIVACVVIRSAITTTAITATININRYGVAVVDNVAKVAVAVIVGYVCASRCASEVSFPVTAR